MKIAITLLAAALFAWLLNGCDTQGRNASRGSDQPEQAASRELPGPTIVGTSSSCGEPPKEISLSGKTYALAKPDTDSEPVMNLGYIACKQGTFSVGDGGPGTLVIHGTAPSDGGKINAVIFIGEWGRALYALENETNETQHRSDP